MAANFLPFEARHGRACRVRCSVSPSPFDFYRLAMGVYPAWQSSRADLVDGLKEGGRGTSGSVRQQRFRKILVGAQVALSVTLLAGAALLIASFIRFNQQNLGFRPQNLWVGFITLPASQYPDVPLAHVSSNKFMTALKRIPGFERSPSAAICRSLAAAVPSTPGPIVRPADRASARPRPSPRCRAGLFQDLGHSPPLRAGIRRARSRRASKRQCLISQAGARKFSRTKIRSERPIGHQP